jgi:hypothetical protein
MGTLLGGGLGTETPLGAYKVQWWLVLFLMHFSPLWHNNILLGAVVCLNFESEACLQGHMVRSDHVFC